MTTPLPIRTLVLAAATALASLSAHAALPEESWWQQGDTTLGVQVEGPAFCAVAAQRSAPANAWIVRGEVVDGRLVEASRMPLRGPGAAALQAATAIDPPDFFVQPTAMVSRIRTSDSPRGDFTIYQPLTQAPSNALWLDLAWNCGGEVEVDKLSALHTGD